MRKVTLCESTGKSYKPKAAGEYPCPIFKLMPGTAWRMDDDTLAHEVVPVTEKITKEAAYLFTVRHHDGRSLHEFKHGDTIYAQPETEDRKATDAGRGRRREVRDDQNRGGGDGEHDQSRVEARRVRLGDTAGGADARAERPARKLAKRPTPALL